MLLRVAVCVAVLAVPVALPALGHAAGAVVPSSTSVETTVPAGGSRTVSLSCPAPSVALHAAVTRLGRSAALRRSEPGRNAGDWRFTFSAGSGAGRRAEAELRCVRVDQPDGVSGARLQVRTRRPAAIQLAPGESQAIHTACGPAYLGTGYGLLRGARGDVRVASAVPTARGWSFVLENTGSARATAGVSARCLKRVVAARDDGVPAELRFRVVRRQFGDRVVSGGQIEFVHACRSGQFSVATGSEVDPLDAIALVRSHAARPRGATWTFARTTPGDEVTTHLVCLRRDSRFR